MRNLLYAATALAAVAVSAPAHATLQVAADFNGTSFVCVDNTGCDTNLTTGVIQIADQTIGGIEVNGSIQTSVGTPANPNPQDILNTSSLSLINTLGVTVTATVTISDTNFAGPVDNFALSTAGTWENATNSTATTKWWADPANVQGAASIGDTPGTLLDSFTSTAASIADSYSHSNSGAFVAGGPVSMTEQIAISLTGNASLINRGQTEILTAAAVPEPASMALLGLGLVGLGFARRWIA